MSEISSLSLLEKQKERNHIAYKRLHQSIEQYQAESDDLWVNDAVSDEQILLRAGFRPESVVDRIGKKFSSLLIQLEKENPAKLFLEEDINEIASSNGLEFLKTRHFQGEKKDFFIEDLKNFQQRLLTLDDIDSRAAQFMHSIRFYLLGLPQSFEGKESIPPKPPLLFYNIGEDIYYLVSSYDSYL